MAVLKVPVTSSDHILGASTAPVTLVEYGDYQCPHCAAAQLPVKQILMHYGSTVCLVFRHFPLTEVHPMARMAAETAEFAGSHGRFWDVHEAIFVNQPRLSPELLLTLVSALELSPLEFQDALASGLHAQKVQADFLGGVRSGVNGTPAFFVNGVRHDADHSFTDLAASIDDAMLALTR
ncbi:DsbA family protein [Lysobacter claricitrinus]|uniref:DsbA family protein n=1 Tax=Lysobacter claricitrinus TaxID=3367728 RepID=UPI0037DA8FBA